MAESVEELLHDPAARRRLLVFAAVGAVVLPALCVYADTSLDWPASPVLRWLLITLFGAGLGTLLGLATLIGKDIEPPRLSLTDLKREWEADQTRFNDLKARAPTDSSAARQYLAALRHEISELEAMLAEHPKMKRESWNPAGLLAAARDELAVAERRYGSGAA